MKAEVDAVLRTGDTVGGVFEVVVRGRASGTGHLRELGRAAGWRAGAGGDVAAGRQGGGDRARSHGGRVAGVGGARRDWLCARGGEWAAYAVHAGAQQCGWHGGRHLQRRRHRGARLSEADFDAAAAAGSRYVSTRARRPKRRTSAATCAWFRRRGWRRKPWWLWRWRSWRWRNLAAIRCGS